jgi:hypothetical protein
VPFQKSGAPTRLTASHGLALPASGSSTDPREGQEETRLLSALGGSQLRLSPPPLRRHLLGCSRPRLCALLQALAPVAVAVAVGMTDSNVQGNGFPAPFAVGMLTARRPPFTSVCARGPDAGFAAFTRRFLAQVADPASPNVSFLRRRGIGGSNPTSSSRGSANHRVSLWTTTAFGPIFRLCSKLGNQLQLPQLAVCGDSACQESVPDDICCAGDPKAPHRLGRRWNLENVGSKSIRPPSSVDLSQS